MLGHASLHVNKANMAVTDVIDSRPRDLRGTKAQAADSADAQRPTSDERWHADDAATLDMLSLRPARGRGGVGSRAGELGPYLPADATHMRDEAECTEAQLPVVMGPERPTWMRKLVPGGTVPSSSSQPDSSTAKPDRKRKAKLKDSGSSKKQKSRRHKKHSKVKERHKHKHRDM